MGTVVDIGQSPGIPIRAYDVESISYLRGMVESGELAMVTPAGAIDGVNTNFTISATPDVIILTLNGIVRYDYTLIGGNIIMDFAPSIGSVLKVYYNYTTNPSGGSGTTDHAALTNLDFASSGHTGFQAALNGTGFVKISGTTISYDNSTYLTSQTSHADVLVDGDFTSQGVMLRGASAGIYSVQAPGNLTKTDDTNVTLTLGGTPTGSLLNSVSLTLGWTGTLADGRIASAATWNAKQAGSSNLTSLSGLSYSSASFVKMTGANTFTLDTTTYSASGHTHAESTVTFTDITTNNATTGQHGYLPKLGGGTTNFLRADGSWAAPPSMTYPSGSGFTIVSSGSSWGTTIPANQVPYFGSAITGTPSASTFLRGDGSWAAGGGGEPALGNPPVNGYVLSSTTSGTRSWVANGVGGGISASLAIAYAIAL